jgi:replicative DNA helicase
MSATARVLRADNGAEATCEDLHRSAVRPRVWSLDERNRVVARQLSAVSPGGLQETFMLRLASGRQLEATTDLPLLTLNGWKRLGELAVGGRVAVLRCVPEPLEPRRMAADEVVLLAHMIGDGSCIKRQPIRYASIDEENLRAVTNAAKHFGVTAKRDEYAAARVTTLRLPAPYHLTHGKRNPIAAWLDGLGLFDKRSYEKFVPAQVFAAPNDQVALFLGHLWATDGCVAWDNKQRQGRIYYGSTSRRLIDDVRQLLLRFGVSTRVYCAPKAGYRDYWFLNLHGVSNQTRFLRNIDVHGIKFFAVREVLNNLQTVKSNDNVDTVPREVWDQVRQDLCDQGISQRAFADAMKTKFCGSTMWKHSPSRSRLHRASAILDNQALHDLTTNDVFWDKIVEIKAIGQREVFDLAVEGADNYVAQGICVRTAI